VGTLLKSHPGKMKIPLRAGLTAGVKAGPGTNGIVLEFIPVLAASFLTRGGPPVPDGQERDYKGLL
jgi:hypothetical protein